MIGKDPCRNIVYGVSGNGERCEMLADYIIKNRCTVRSAAAHFGISKSTIHKDITRKLRYINFGKYEEVKEVIDINKSERHIRGGLATKIKYQNLKKRMTDSSDK